MGKILNPATLSTEFGIEESTLAEFGVVNVLLATDTLLFIDPMLLVYSQHPEIHDGAVKSYNSRFEQIIKLLTASKERGDVACSGQVIPDTALSFCSATAGASPSLN